MTTREYANRRRPPASQSRTCKYTHTRNIYITHKLGALICFHCVHADIDFPRNWTTTPWQNQTKTTRVAESTLGNWFCQHHFSFSFLLLFFYFLFRAPVSDEWGGGENPTHPPPSGIVKSKRPHREISFHHFDYVLLVYLTFSPFFIYLFKRFKSLHFFVWILNRLGEGIGDELIH
jgi:hypothetical protein